MKRPDPRYFLSRFSSSVEIERHKERAGKRLILPFYHCVSDQPGKHLRHLYSIKGIKEFEQDVDLLLKYYKPLSPELIIKGEVNEDTSGFILSFDDGLREVYDTIAPILLRRGVPAIFFLNNDFIDNKGLFYRYKLSLLIDHFKNKLDEPAGKTLLKSRKEYKTNPEKLYRYGYMESQSLDELASAEGINFSDYLVKEGPYLSASQISSLKDQGFFLGGHSRDHKEFSLMQEDEQVKEILDSTLGIRELFDLDYGLFAFPFSDYGVGEKLAKHLVKDNTSGVHAIFGTSGLKNMKPGGCYQRLSMEKYPGSSEGIIQTEYLYFTLKRMFGR